VEVEGSRAFVACGESGLWVVQANADGGFTLLGVEDMGGPVAGLFTRGGRVWAEIHRVEARPVSQPTGATVAVPVNGSAPPAPQGAVVPAVPAVVEAPPGREGEVTSAELGEVVINLGSDDGLKHGDRVELSVATKEKVGGEIATRRQTLAIGVVTTVSERFARVKLGLNEQVPIGASARSVTKGPSESRTAPPRAAGLYEVGLKVRPFAALDGLGAGVLTQGWVGYRFKSELYVSAEIHPFAYGDGEGTDAVVPVSGTLNAAYDRDIFSIGLGFGGQTVKATDFRVEPGSGILIAQFLRLGARDGLHLSLRSDIVLFHSVFEFSGLVGAAQLPVGSGTWLVAEGGGGNAGFGYGELGVRALFRGNGGPGSLFFSVVVGGVTVFQQQQTLCGGDFVFQCAESVSYSGPMLGVGVEWRF